MTTQHLSPLTMLLSRHTSRRDFITLLGGATAAWPLAASVQQAERVRRIGVLMHLPENGPEAQARMRAFLQGVQQLGWAEGRNVQIDYRFGAADVDRARSSAAELIALAPDVIRLPVPVPWQRCSKRPAPCRSCSRKSRIRLTPASSTAWRARAATPPDFPCSRNTALAGNGLNCSRRSRRG